MRTRSVSIYGKFLCLTLVYSLLLNTLPFLASRVEAAQGEKVGASAATSLNSTKKGGKRPGELLVRFRENASNEDKTALVESKGAHRIKAFRGESRIEKLKLQEGQDVDALAAELRLNPVVELVEPNYLIGKDDTTPDDPNFSEQWALKNTGSTGGQPNADINASSAWQTSTGSPTTVIAVIDSGIDFSHPDLKNNQWSNQSERANNRDDDRNGYTNDLYGWDWVTDSGNILDEQGHGTIVAGIIAAHGNNQTGVTGVMWRAGLMSLRVLDNTGTGDIADAVEAIDYAVAQGAQVINCSWGTDEESSFLRDAIERAGKRGVVVVTSAGNDGRDLEAAPYYPASFNLSNLISVASTDQFDQLTSFSSYGSTRISIAAPGTDILTTQMGGGYRSVTGTSASAPLVSGIAGLIKTVSPFLTAAGTKVAITDGARKVAVLEGRVATAGVASAAGAIASLRGPSNPPPGSGNGNNGNIDAGSLGNGNSGQQSPRPPAAPPRGSGGTGRDGGFSVDPIPQTTTVPGGTLPNLDERRKLQNSAPKAPTRISANQCYDCEPSVPPPSGGTDPYFATARTRPQNETGKADQSDVDLGSRNFTWGTPLLGLKGRTGLDLALSLVYNSLVWTKQGTVIKFNADRGIPSPGFRLGVPVIEQSYYNDDTGDAAYLMIMPSGDHVELRRVGTTHEYVSSDSSYTQLINYFSYMIARTKDGTQYKFVIKNDALYHCTEIKDRNGNLITISYYDDGRLSSIVDTLGRTVNFNYDANNGNVLSSITQDWGGITHTWATFGYGVLYLQGNFPGLAIGGTNYANIRVLNFVGLADGTYRTFDYTQWGQVWRINSYAADGHLRNYVAYNLPGSGYLSSSPQSDCPRFTERREWAENWNGNVEAVTYFSVDPNSAGGEQPAWSQVQTPDGTVYKETFATTGWGKGLTTQSEVFVGPTRVKLTTIAWTQDDPGATQQLNPRPYEINVYDASGNRHRTYITYTYYGLPSDVYEYAADASTVLRRTQTVYNLDTAYTDRRIIGLVSGRYVYSGTGALESKVNYHYDWGNPFLVSQGAATQHDSTNYGAGFTFRGNLVSVQRWDINDPSNQYKAVEFRTGYNTTGAPIFSSDPSGHRTDISYSDSFSDNNSRNTFAYPTTVTDPDSYASTAKYNYDTGAVTFVQDAKGSAQSFQYDGAGRIERVTNQANGAYQRWVYAPYGDISTFTTIQSGAGEFFEVTYFDGAGRVRSKGSDNPGSAGSYTGQFWIYDNMGRLWHYSNPAEMNGSWVPSGDDASGWTWTYQTYDWQGRPLQTTNPDGTTRESTYSGCGCAGGEQVTTRDERGRRKRITMDVLGRLSKVEELNWDPNTVYSTTTYAYNARDQITQINQAGLPPRTFNYDGHGRIWQRTTPEQGTTTYTYNVDDTVNTVTDARGASSTFAYNGRHLVTGINYGVPADVAATSNVTYSYDAVGNRTLMTDGLGSVSYVYNTLSQMMSETRTFTGVGSYKIAYEYGLGGQLTGISHYNNANALNTWVGYNHDKAGRVTGVTGAGYANVSTYASNLQYRAFGALKAMTYGNSTQLGLQYDNRMRLKKWDVTNIANVYLNGYGYEYNYSILGDNSFRVSYAKNPYDSTLNRSYDYDHLGRLQVAHSGNEADAHVGQAIWGQPPTGPYSHHYNYDQYGNLNYRAGWGGTNPSYSATFTNNRLPNIQFDASGNMTDAGGGWVFQYDATGQQTLSAINSQYMYYDGDRLRGKKTVGGVTTYYLRSSVLGGQVIAELNGGGGWSRGYVYLGSQLLALQQNGVYWMHQDPVTKGERITDGSRTIVSAIELDPWGGELFSKMNNSSFQQRWYTTYEMDENGSYEAMNRRYNRWWSRFEQPDPYGGSYNLTDPQSFNRYSYAQNDPVNFVDPSGLVPNLFPIWGANGGWADASRGFWGWGDLNNRPRNEGRKIISDAEARTNKLMMQYLEVDESFIPTLEFVTTLQGIFPCGPTGEELKRKRQVRKALAKAFKDSNYGKEDAHEEGGWIYQDVSGRLRIERAPSGGRGSINLANPPKIFGFQIVGTFHTHPNRTGTESRPGYTWDYQPSDNDILAAFNRGVPGLVMTDHGIIPYGPKRRGSDPDRASSPGVDGGFPGNVDTRRRCP